MPRDVYVRDSEDNEDYYGAQAPYAIAERKASASASAATPTKKKFSLGSFLRKPTTKRSDGALV